jgi:hypothetical protein
MKNGSSHRTSSKVPKTMVLKNAASRPDIIDKQEAIPLQFNKKSLEEISHPSQSDFLTWMGKAN